MTAGVLGAVGRTLTAGPGYPPNAGDLVTLRNHTSSAVVNLPTIGGGTAANVNASVLMQQLS